MVYGKSEALTEIHRSSDHSDVLFGEPLIAQIINAIQTSGRYRGIPRGAGLGEGE